MAKVKNWKQSCHRHIKTTAVRKHVQICLGKYWVMSSNVPVGTEKCPQGGPADSRESKVRGRAERRGRSPLQCNRKSHN